MLFGGLITIPLWGYLNTPLALMEVMVSDLPHVMYHPPKGGTPEEEANRITIMHHQQELIKKGGLSAVGVNLNFQKGKVIDGNALIEKLKRK